jgi:hypothetical protein
MTQAQKENKKKSRDTGNNKKGFQKKKNAKITPRRSMPKNFEKKKQNIKDSTPIKSPLSNPP